MNNKTIWMIEDFIKDTYLENGVDNLQFGTISKQLSMDINDIIIACINLEKIEKIQLQYDIRDDGLNLLHSEDSFGEAYDKAKDFFDEKNDLFKKIYVSIRLTKGYKMALNKIKNREM